MAFTAYTPTAQLTAAERTQAGYYNATKAWATAQADILQYYSVSADDTAFTLTFTPLAANLANFPMVISINGSYVYFENIYTGTSKVTSTFTHNNFTKDLVFRIHNDGQNFIISPDDMSKSIAIITGKTFDGNADTKALIAALASVTYIFTGGSSHSFQFTSSGGGINRNCADVSATYLLSRLAVPNVDMIADKVYTLDGGIGLPPAGVFTIAGKQFYRLFNNCVFKMED